MRPLLHTFLDRIVRKGTLEVETGPGKRFFVGDDSGERVAVRVCTENLNPDVVVMKSPKDRV